MDRIFYDNQEYAKYSDKFLKRFNLADQAAYDALPAATKNDDSKVFFIPDIPEHDYIYKWDFTKSLVDEIQGLTAELNNGLTRDSEGLKFTAAKHIAYLGNIDLVGKTIEIDISKFDFKGNTSNHIRLLTNTNAKNSKNGTGALIFRASTYNYWSSYLYQDSMASFTTHGTMWGSSYGISDRNYFNNKTIKLVFNDYNSNTSNEIKLYVDDIYIGNSTNNYYRTYNNLCNHTLIGGCLGQTSASSGDQCYDMTITGVRIYNNEEEES